MGRGCTSTPATRPGSSPRNLTFEAGEERLEAGPGDIVIVPPNVPHKFTNHGPAPANLVCIHASPTLVTEWQE